MSFYQNLLAKISLLEHRLEEKKLYKSHHPWYQNSRPGSKPSLSWFIYAEELPDKLKLRYYKILLALARIFMIIRGAPSSNFHIFTQAGKEGIYICNYNYCYYKGFHKKTKWKFLTMVTAATIIVSLIVALIFPGEPRAHAAIYSWGQTDWSGGESALTANHTSNQSNWTKYAAGASASIIGALNSIKLNLTSVATPWTQTDFSGGADTGSTASEPANRTNWAKYYSKTSSIANSASDIKLNAISAGWTQTDWSGNADTSATASEPANRMDWTKFYSKNVGMDVSATDLKLANAASNFLDTTNMDFGEWYDASWTKRKGIVITENSGSTLTDYQVKITVAYDSDMQADFGDIRFADSNGSTLIDHWLESKTDSNTADFWVEIPTLAASSTKAIYIYYGNPSAASASSLANTFGASVATSAIPGCALGEACIVSSNQTISTSGTYGYPYIRINSGVTLTVSGDNIIAYFDSIGRFDIEGTLTSTGGGAGGLSVNNGASVAGTSGGTYWPGPCNGGNGGTGENGANGGTGAFGGICGGGGGGGGNNDGCSNSTGNSGGDNGGGGGGSKYESGCQGGTQTGATGAFLSVKANNLAIKSSGLINITGSNGATNSGPGGGGALFEANASELFIISGSISVAGGAGGNAGPQGAGGGGGSLSYINYAQTLGAGSVSVTAGNGDSGCSYPPCNTGGTATLITPAGTQTGTPSGATGGTTSKTYTGGSEPTIGAAGAEEVTAIGTSHSNTAVSGTGAGASIVIISSWSYRMPITLSPATPAANYQAKVNLTNAVLTNAQLTGGNANGNDIRFTGSDGTTLQDYWVESWSATGTTVTATIWVEVATSGTSQIYIHYGNPSAASASSLANTFGASAATSAIPGCALGEACIVSSNQTISTSGTYGYPYIRINSGVTLTVSGDNIIAYFDSIGRFDIQGTIASTGGGAPAANGGTYWGTGSGGGGGKANTCGTLYDVGGTYGGSGGGGWGGGGCAWAGCPTPPDGTGGSYGGGGASQFQDCGTQRGAFLSIKSGILKIPTGGSITASGQPGCTGRDGVSGGGGVLLEMNASKLMAFSGSMTLTAGNSVNASCGTSGGGGGGILTYINYSSFVGTGSVTLTAGSGGSLGGGGTVTLITPDGTQTGSPSGATGGMTSKTYTTGGSEPSATVGNETALLAGTSTFTSSIKDTGASNYWGNIVFNTTLNGGTVTIKVRTSNSATMTGAPAFSTCNDITSGANITGNNCVTSPDRYVQYQATLNMGASSPSLNDVTIYYGGGYVPSATLSSSKYQADLGNNDNRLASFAWSETKPANTNIKFQVRTASSAANLDSAPWCGPDDSTPGSCTSSTYFTTNTGQTIDDTNSNGTDDQWVQYKAFLESTDGVNTPTLADVSLGYANNLTGNYVSSKYQADLGNNDNRLASFAWSETKPANTNIKLQVRTASSAANLDSAPWCGPDDGVPGSCSSSTYFTNSAGQTIDDTNSNGTDDQWVQYKAFFDSDGSGQPIASNITLGYANNFTGNFTSSAYNTEVSWNAPSQLIWNEDATLPSNTTLKFQIATSPDNSTWTSFLGPDDTSSTYYQSTNASFCSKVSSTVTCNIPQISVSDGQDDKWIKYKAWFGASADKVASPVISSVSFVYDQNVAPVVSVSSSSQQSDGTVSAIYTISDAEQTSATVSLFADIGVTLNEALDNSTDPGGNAVTVAGANLSSFPNSGTIQIENEEITYTGKSGNDLTGALRARNSTRFAGHASGAAVVLKATAGNISGEIGNITGITSSSSSPKTVVWNIKNDLSASGLYLTGVKIRVSANDSQRGNPVGTGDSSPFALDAKNPTYGAPPLKINSVATGDKLTDISLSDDSAYQVRFANSSTVNGSTCAADIASSSYESYSATKSWTLNALANGVSTVCFQAKDVFNNEAAVTFVATPETPLNTRINDISIPPSGKYKLLVWWNTVPDPGSFVKYNFYRCDRAEADASDKCDSISNYSLLTTITNRTTNYCIDEGDSDCADNSSGLLNNTTTYFYKITAEDVDGISLYSTAASGLPTFPNVAGTPNGSTVGEADTAPPVISFTSSGSNPAAADTAASVTFSAADNISPTVFLSVEYATLASFSNSKESANPSMITSGENGIVSLAGLASNTTHYYKIKARDNSGNSSELGPYDFKTTIDSTLPSAIIDLAAPAADLTATSLTLSWLSPGDDSATGTASSYDIRYSTISASNIDTYWDTAAQIANEPLPQSAGASQSMVIANLTPSTVYYFAIKTKDEIPNTSLISNIVTVTTPAQADLDIPAITLISSAVPTATSVTITWTTANKTSSSLVDFGTTTSYGTTQGNSSELVNSHSVTLVGLAPSTNYKFRVKSLSDAGNTGTNDNAGLGYPFTTAGAAVGVAPDLSSIGASSITATSALVRWTTSGAGALSDSAVGYSVDPDKTYDFEAGSTTPTTSHSVTLMGLAPATKYFYRVKSRNGDQLAIASSDVSGDFNFTTAPGADSVPPSISDIQVASITANKATITWSTNENADSFVEFGLIPGVFTSVQGNPSDSLLVHSVQLTSLTPDTQYYFQVRSTDAGGNKAVLVYASGFRTTTGAAVDCPAPTVCGGCRASESCPVSDTTAPIIIAIKVSDIAFNTATISWTTDENANSMVNYDTYSYDIKGKYAYSGGSSKDAVKSHSVILNSLDSATTYYFRVLSTDARGNTAESADQSFKTPAISESKDQGAATTTTLKKEFESIAKTLIRDNLATEENIKDILSRIASPPVIGSEGPTVKDIQSYGATIVWQTDRKANSIVKFTADDQTKSLAKLIGWEQRGKLNEFDTKHEVFLLGLAPATSYSFQAQSQDILGNTSSSDIKTFTTAAASSIFNVLVTDLNLTSAKITWETANLSTSSLEYGPTASYGNYLENKDEKVRNHAISLTTLAPSSVFHFRVRSTEELGTILVSDDYTFATPSLPEITKYFLGEVKDNSIALAWTSNIPIDANVRYTNAATREVKNIGKEEKTTDHALTIPDLEAGETYRIEIQGRDEAGNLAAVPAFDVQTGMDTAPPEISQVRSQSAVLSTADDRVQSIISWRTNELASTQVLWDLGGTRGDALANESALDANLTTNHLVVLTQFKPGTVYRFRVASADKFGNTTVSADYTVLAPVKRQSIIQMIINQFENIFGWTKGLGL